MSLAKQCEQNWANKVGYFKHNKTVALQRRRWLARLITDLKPKSVLEIGCHEGTNLKFIADLDSNIGLTGIDINALGLEHGRKIYHAANIEFVNGSVYDLLQIFADCTFDVVFSMGVLIHIPPANIEAVCNKMYQLANHYVVAVECHGQPVEFHKNLRWTHDYIKSFMPAQVSVNTNVVDKGGGAEHLIMVAL